MRKLLVLLLALGACKSAAPSTPAESGRMTSGSSSAELAVANFLGAVRAGDLQAMGLLWGTEEGPAASQMDREQLEKRGLIMQCFFNHDSARIVERVPSPSGTQIFRVELKKGTLTRTPTMRTVRGPGDRWYLNDGDIEAVKDFCRNPPGMR